MLSPGAEHRSRCLTAATAGVEIVALAWQTLDAKPTLAPVRRGSSFLREPKTTAAVHSFAVNARSGRFRRTVLGAGRG